VVDNYCKWRIINALTFLEKVRNEEGAQAVLDDIVYSELREELGLHTLREVLETRREALMQKVTRQCSEKARAYGIEIVDVRIKRADLPPENEKHVFARMKAERERESKKYRAEGREKALEIKSKTDKQRTIILSEAYKIEQKLRGEGDREAARIYAEAYKQDPDFFEFLRTLEAYKKSLRKDTVIVESSKADFFTYLRSDNIKR
jgi:membrane protease subunit HflC